MSLISANVGALPLASITLTNPAPATNTCCEWGSYFRKFGAPATGTDVITVFPELQITTFVELQITSTEPVPWLATNMKLPSALLSIQRGEPASGMVAITTLSLPVTSATFPPEHAT